MSENNTLNSDAKETDCHVLARQARQLVLKMAMQHRNIHIGGSLSAIDIILSLYTGPLALSHDSQRCNKFILSKGHASPALYAVLAVTGRLVESEMFNVSLQSNIIQPHPDPRTSPEVIVATGSLGLGLAAASGIAYVNHDSNLSQHVYVLLGDGELNQGVVWEAAMFASHHKLSNLTAIVDRNCFQYTGPTADVMEIEPLCLKWQAFGWTTIEADGHNHAQLSAALSSSRDDKPVAIIAHTVKGKGVSFMEGRAEWHMRQLTYPLYEAAISELQVSCE